MGRMGIIRKHQFHTVQMAVGFLGVVIALTLFGCKADETSNEESAVVYYKNTDGTGLVSETYETTKLSVEKQIDRMLQTMEKDPDEDGMTSVFPAAVEVERWELADSDLLLYFNEAYRDMDTEQELLLRAGVVQTLVQLPEIDYVAFYVGEDPLKNADGDEIGYMSAESFVQNVGSSLHSYEDADLTLYFADEAGDHLKEETVQVRYNSNTSLQKLVVEQLLAGPRSEGLGPTIPEGTKLLGVSVTDGVCYVNFDEGFLDAQYNITPKVAVYSVVNSIIENGGVGQVQILINGQSDVQFQDSIDLSKPLTQDLEEIEETKERSTD